ncbi:MAG: DNA-processing protein DprA, partial [Clostridium sp.]|nr:DNA-processing protein DprA [Clostridium sp.]
TINNVNIEQQKIEWKTFSDTFLTYLPQPVIEPWLNDTITKEVMDYYEIRFALLNISNKLKLKLLQMYNNEENIYNNINEIIKSDIITIKEKIKFKESSYKDEVNFINSLNNNFIKTVKITEKDYPEKLRNIDDPPYILFYRGDLSLAYHNMIAVVGSRKSSIYGLDVTKYITREICRVGYGVVSGVAYGIDTAAHKEALISGGKTIGILGCGLDIVYPKSNKNLYKEIYNNGLLISEFPMGVQPMPYNFPRRNRIISGLSSGVIVIEASEKSGSLITANLALEQGKDVMAIPGSIFSNTSKGCHQLLRDGARIFTGLEDLHSFLNVTKKESEKRIKNDSKNLIMSVIKNEPIHFDKIFESVNIDRIALYELLFEMQNKNEIICLPGNYYAKLS